MQRRGAKPAKNRRAAVPALCRAPRGPHTEWNGLPHRARRVVGRPAHGIVQTTDPTAHSPAAAHPSVAYTTRPTATSAGTNPTHNNRVHSAS